MLRVMLTAVLVCALVVLAAELVGRAAGYAVQDRVLIVRDGISLDCQRVVRDGNTYYENCSQVP